MSDNKPNDGATGGPCVKALREAMRLYAEACIDQAKRRESGKISEKELRAILAYFQQPNPGVDAYLGSLMEECKEYHRVGFMNEMRSDTLNRVIVSLFEDKMMSRNDPMQDNPQQIPRQFLPAFFQWAHAAMGDQFVHEKERICNVAKERVIQQHGMSFEWAQLEKDPEVLKCSQEAAYRLIIPFGRNFKSEVSKFIKKMNYNLTETDRSFGVGKDYLFNERRTKILLFAIVRRIDAASLDKPQRAILARNIGETKFPIIERIKIDIKTLDERK